MDDAMLSRLMQSYGAANTAENANRIRQFAASNPNVLEHRAMGMRGSVVDDNSDVLGAMLDKFIAQTDIAPPRRVEVGAPEVQQTMPTVQNASAPTRKSATAAPAPQMGPNLPMASGAVNPLDAPTQPPAGKSGSFWDDVLISLLGATSVAGRAAMNRRGGGNGGAGGGGGNAPTPQGTPEATFVGRMGEAARNDPLASGYLQGPNAQLAGPNAQLAGPNAQLEAPNAKLPAPDKRIGSSRPDGNYEGTGKEIEGVNARNQAQKTAKRDVLQKEIDAENEGASRLQEQMRKRAADEAATADLVKKAKRAVGRK